MMKKRILSIFLLLTLLIGSMALTGCQRNIDPISKTGVLFDTIVTITLYDSDDESILDECFAMCESYQQQFSRTIDTSEVSQINDASGNAVEVSDDTRDLLQIGLDYYELSGGKFDFTIGELSSLWDFGNNEGTIPADSDIQAALSTVGGSGVHIDGNYVSLDNPKTMIDLGGIAKGYIADQLKTYLLSQGVNSAMINLGGNILAVGSKTDGSDYTIGIQKPFDEDTVMLTVNVSDKSVVTSGCYERYFKIGDKIYHHILDTSTGYPVDNNLYSVTIISDKSVDGDGLSTTCYALGLEKGMELIESLDNTEAVFITNDYQVYTTSGMGTDIPYSIED